MQGSSAASNHVGATLGLGDERLQEKEWWEWELEIAENGYAM